MQGRHHVLVGIAGWAAAAAVCRVPPVTLAAGAAVCGGAALLPDLDHPQATLAHTLGPVTRCLSKGVARLAGGHRRATHSFLFCAAMGAATVLAVQAWGIWSVRVMAFLCAALAVRQVIGRGHWLAVAAGAAAAAWWLSEAIPVDSPYLGLVIGAGCLLHLVGDSVTRGAFPWLWPYRGRWSADLLTTGSWQESFVVTVVIAGVSWLVWSTYGT